MGKFQWKKKINTQVGKLVQNLNLQEEKNFTVQGSEIFLEKTPLAPIHYLAGSNKGAHIRVCKCLFKEFLRPIKKDPKKCAI